MKDMSLKQKTNDTTEKDIQISDKPVAWKSTLQTDWYTSSEKMLEGKYDANYWIPLYTAPRELSDEEIMNLAEYHGINDWLYETSVTDFARAILKKASE